MKIAFASGKGGTGKTLLSTNLAAYLAKKKEVVYVDADVEEPNGHIFLEAKRTATPATVPLPEVIKGKCTGCGVCQKTCAFHAILALKDNVLIFPELCHSCAACVIACPEGALKEVPYRIGEIRHANGRLEQYSGHLDVGQARATPLVEQVVECASPKKTIIIDAPPGTSCSAMAAVRGSDLVVLVTEPTPFGLHDLQLAVEMCKALKLSVVAVLNRSDLGDGGVEAYLSKQNIPLIAQIPFEKSLAQAYSKGFLAIEHSDKLKKAIESLESHLESL